MTGRLRLTRQGLIVLLAGPIVALLALTVLHATVLAPRQDSSSTEVSVAAQPVNSVKDDGATATPSSATPPAHPVARPARIAIPKIAVDAELVPVGLHDSGAMEVPDNGLAGWYEHGPRPGSYGPAVIVAHVDSHDGPDVFFRLGDLQVGDEIAVIDRDGDDHRFVVLDSEQVPKNDLPVERIWADEGQVALRLITCGGTFDAASGHYDDNIIVYAESAL